MGTYPYAFAAVYAALFDYPRFAVPHSYSLGRTAFYTVCAACAFIPVKGDRMKIFLHNSFRFSDALTFCSVFRDAASVTAQKVLFRQGLSAFLCMCPLPFWSLFQNYPNCVFILGRPMPAPKPISRTLSGAVDQPSLRAREISSMPGPMSFVLIVTKSGLLPVPACLPGCVLQDLIPLRRIR